MRLVVRQSDGATKEFRFTEGPISLGRAADNQVFLPDKTVSKLHALISSTEDGKWLVEDKGSANKTYLNGEEIQKAELKTGDRLSISDFTIEISLEDDTVTDEATQLEDTLHLEAALATPPHEIVVRKPDAGHAPAMRLAAGRLTEFAEATEGICGASNLDELLLALLDVTLKQFNAFHVWCALREQPGGPMTCHAGKKRDGQAVELNEIQLREKINDAVEKGQFYVMPRVSAQIEEDEAIRSAMVAAIVRPDGCYGVLYVDNGMKDKHYSLSDLDYLMLIAIHTAAILKQLLNL